jgi:nucleoside-triphosphatase
VDVAGFERLLAALDLRHAPTRVIIIDEIGTMECLSSHFAQEVTALLDSSKTVIATIALKGTGFIQQVKERPDCRLITVTVANRDRLADSLFTERQHTLGHSSGNPLRH